MEQLTKGKRLEVITDYPTTVIALTGNLRVVHPEIETRKACE